MVDNKSTEKEFTYNLIESLYSIDRHTGSILNSFRELIIALGKNNTPDEIIANANEVFRNVEIHIQDYNNCIYNLATQHWNELGEPTSMENYIQQKVGKKIEKTNIT